jgi:hypothetical protein
MTASATCYWKGLIDITKNVPEELSQGYPSISLRHPSRRRGQSGDAAVGFHIQSQRGMPDERNCAGILRLQFRMCGSSLTACCGW